MKRLSVLLIAVLILTLWISSPQKTVSAEASTEVHSLRVLMASFRQDANSNGNYPGRSETLVPVDMRIVGSRFELAVFPDDDWSEGALVLYGEISRNTLFGDSLISEAHSLVTVREINGQYLIFGNLIDINISSFPSGTGIDLNAGDKLYVNINYENHMNIPHWAKATGTIYYILR